MSEYPTISGVTRPTKTQSRDLKYSTQSKSTVRQRGSRISKTNADINEAYSTEGCCCHVRNMLPIGQYSRMKSRRHEFLSVVFVDAGPVNPPSFDSSIINAQSMLSEEPIISTSCRKQSHLHGTKAFFRLPKSSVCHEDSLCKDSPSKIMHDNLMRVHLFILCSS